MVKGFTENYKTLIKEIKEVTNKWKYILYSLNGRINIVKMYILPKITQSQCNAYQNHNGIFAKTGKNILKFILNQKGLQMLQKESIAGGNTLTDFNVLQIYDNLKVWY